MSLKERLNRLQKNLPQKGTEEEQNEFCEKIISGLIDNRHKEFIESLRQVWRISIKGDEATLQERVKYDRLTIRLNEIIEEHIQKDQLV